MSTFIWERLFHYFCVEGRGNLQPGSPGEKRDLFLRKPLGKWHVVRNEFKLVQKLRIIWPLKTLFFGVRGTFEKCWQTFLRIDQQRQVLIWCSILRRSVNKRPSMIKQTESLSVYRGRSRRKKEYEAESLQTVSESSGPFSTIIVMIRPGLHRITSWAWFGETNRIGICLSFSAENQERVTRLCPLLPGIISWEERQVNTKSLQEELQKSLQLWLKVWECYSEDQTAIEYRRENGCALMQDEAERSEWINNSLKINWKLQLIDKVKGRLQNQPIASGWVLLLKRLIAHPETLCLQTHQLEAKQFEEACQQLRLIYWIKVRRSEGQLEAPTAYFYGCSEIPPSQQNIRLA